MKVNLTLTVPLDIEGADDMLAVDMVRFIQWGLNDWSDGRYRFAAETLQRAITDNVKDGIRKAIFDQEIEKYKGEYVPHFNDQGEENGKTAKGVITSEPLMRAVHTFIYWDDVRVNIEKI